MTIMQDPVPKVTCVPGWDLSRVVIGSAQRPCAAPDADPDAWFPAEPVQDARRDPAGEKHAAAVYELEARAAALCRGCPVRVACLERAIRLEGPRLGHGIAGGQTPRQRQDIKISRGLVPAGTLAVALAGAA
jgi:Transcription factor WhiB